MIGTEKLSQIRNELYAALRPKKAQIEAWLEREMAKLSNTERRDPKRVEVFVWIRDALRAAGAETKVPRKPLAAADRREPDVGKELVSLCNALRRALKEKKAAGRKSKKANGKRKPAA